MLRNSLAVLCAAALAGCAGGPVGWGGNYEVLFADQDRIKIQWDNLTFSEDAVTQMAREHCTGMGKDARLIDVYSDAASMGLVRSKTYECIGDEKPEPDVSLTEIDPPTPVAPEPVMMTGLVVNNSVQDEPRRAPTPAPTATPVSNTETEQAARLLGEEFAKCYGIHKAFANYVTSVLPGSSQQELADGSARGWYLVSMLMFRESGMSEASIEPAIESYSMGFRSKMATTIQAVRAGIQPQSDMMEPMETCKANYGEIQKEIITRFRREMY